MDIDEIKKLLPHRYPFLLVDRVVEIELHKRILAYKNISANEEVFNGHFPERQIFPGVMIIEAMAQTAGLLGFKTMDKKPSEGSIYLFVGADKARFKRQVVPGDQLFMTAKIITEKRGIWKFDCEATVDGELAAKAIILCADRKV